jgi:hypothetical protein
MRIYADPDSQHWFNVRNLHSSVLLKFFLYIFCIGICLLYEIRLSQLNTLLIDVPKFYPLPPPHLLTSYAAKLGMTGILFF